MPIPPKINVPSYPRFMFTPDQQSMQLYITCTKPLALIYVHQTTPAQLYIIEGPQDAAMLRDCADWYRNTVSKKIGGN